MTVPKMVVTIDNDTGQPAGDTKADSVTVYLGHGVRVIIRTDDAENGPDRLHVTAVGRGGAPALAVFPQGGHNTVVLEVQR